MTIAPNMAPARCAAFFRNCAPAHPLSNMLPAVAISLFALSMLDRNGVWVLAGLIATLVSAGLMLGVFYGLKKSVGYVASCSVMPLLSFHAVRRRRIWRLSNCATSQARPARQRWRWI
jgi:hypothetical protein